MTPIQLAELLDYVKNNNCWGSGMYEVTQKKKRKAIKYVDIVFDSRDGKIFSLKFRSPTHGKDTTFRIESEEDIKKCYKYLDEIMND